MDKAWSTNKYTRNVPGAPMCACIEQMPVVSGAHCTQAHPVQTFDIKTSNGNLSLELKDTTVTFTDCGDFKKHYYDRFPQQKISDYFVDKCPDTPPFLEDMGYGVRDSNWIPMYGKGTLEYERMSES